MGGSLLGVIVGALLLGVWFATARAHRQIRSEAAAKSGAAFTVYAAIRRLDAGRWAGRWRHGFLTVNGSAMEWRPRRPRPGPRVALSDVLFGRPRPVAGIEYWWVNPAMKIFTIHSFHDPSARYDLALLPESVELVVDGGKSSGA
ncbi:hypothetical protein Rhe02_81530 [Rhizocola hellebori]|uniref:DUF2550 family protein n=1 Tax=Rhizocola hellebori TaxID=1392758 RepID=A0A8J3QIY6_9ACTN|nr:hypothetical protein [Rhizocola hellebori]GIH10086.1 hypothetical protein Rhe02_81530 [Rhizocola hellebori]